MGNRIKIAANIMDSDLARIAEQVEQLQEAGADLLHMDVMDGHYVPAFVGGPRMLKAIKRVSDIPVDVHLMVSNPDQAVDWFLDAGADIVMFHYEAAQDVEAVLDKIHSFGAKAGVALCPDVKPEAVTGFARQLDCIIAMTVNPGSSGQKFMESGCYKIPELRELCREDVDIYVDGGMNIDTIKIAAGYGANVFAMASAIFGAEKPFKETIPVLRDAAEAGAATV